MHVRSAEFRCLRITELLCAVVGTVAVSGCHIGMRARYPEFAKTSYDVQRAVSNHDSGVVTNPVEFGGEYSLDEYLAVALAQHPKVQAARWAVDSAAWQTPVAASLEDPKLSITALPAPIQTAAGRQNVVVGVSQKTPIREKQARREAIARAAAQEASARLAAAERGVIAQVRNVFAELAFRQAALEVLKDERDLLAEVTEIVVALYKTEKVSQQDIAQAELAQLTVEQELVAARQQMRSAQTAMARLLRVAPASPLLARGEACLARVADDVQSLLDQAVASRPELHALIAKVNQNRMAACLAKLDHIPDPTIGAAWIGIGDSGVSPVADGKDAVLLNVSMNLPIYRKRIEAKIKSAEAQAISSAREYDDLRDETLRVVYDEYTQLQSKIELMELLRAEVIPKANETLEVAIKAYSVSEVDIQQVLDNWRKLMRLEMSLRELERDHRQSVARLERALGTDIRTVTDCEIMRLPDLQEPSHE